MLKDVLSRIDKRLRALGLSESAAAKKSGLSDSAIRNIRRAVEKDPHKTGGVTSSTLAKLAPTLKTSVAWLLEEAGPEIVEGNVVDHSFVPAKLISWVSAGALSLPEQAHDDELEYAPTVYAPDLDPAGDWIALRVDGDSMNRISPHDSIIFVNRKDKRLVPNACYIIGDGEGGATYKRFRPPNTWEPVSTNPQHQPFVLPHGVEPDIIGRVRKTILAM
ncbi:LexA family transcriptional regulator [Aquamicrobium sp. cd-1]|uniref:LexA family transcriptional regulator n=2 Tax=Aquamicrobium zhengzhouense TaxID=2781738 RepID=A0ABS0SA24_9HYPH|nr:LexA family transcriptional regulator [Aquamicrobium zhengzhouense]